MPAGVAAHSAVSALQAKTASFNHRTASSSNLAAIPSASRAPVSATYGDSKRARHRAHALREGERRRTSLRSLPSDKDLFRPRLRSIDILEKDGALALNGLEYCEAEETWPETFPYQTAVRRAYDSPKVQIVVALLIFANFVVSAIQAQIAPHDNPEWYVVAEWAFCLIFLGELCWNMYGSWWFLFWRSWWNW